MRAYARWLFGSAGAANLVVASAMSLGQGWFVALMGLDPAFGSNVVVMDLAALLIGLFGVGYIWVARDPARYRPLIPLGAAGKLAAAALVLAGAIAIPHLWRFFALVSGDIVLAVLFLDFLRRFPAPAGG
jgi:hypothetical protein